MNVIREIEWKMVCNLVYFRIRGLRKKQQFFLTVCRCLLLEHLFLSFDEALTTKTNDLFSIFSGMYPVTKIMRHSHS